MRSLPRLFDRRKSRLLSVGEHALGPAGQHCCLEPMPLLISERSSDVAVDPLEGKLVDEPAHGGDAAVAGAGSWNDHPVTLDGVHEEDAGSVEPVEEDGQWAGFGADPGHDDRAQVLQPAGVVGDLVQPDSLWASWRCVRSKPLRNAQGSAGVSTSP